jgi:hypothetical protein
MSLISLFGTYADDAPVLVWIPILLAVTMLIAVGAKILTALTEKIPVGRLKKLGSVVGCALLFLNAIPAAFIYWSLMNPLPIPRANLPDPNGYDDFRDAGEMLPPNLLVNNPTFDAETTSEQSLRQASDELEAVSDRVRQGLTKPVMIDQKYTKDGLALPSISNFRTIARGFDAQGRLYLKQNQPDQATGVFLDGARFGALLSRGGLMIDDLVGVACTGIACNGLYASSKQIPVEHIRDIIAAIKNLETERDPAEDVAYRDRVWSQRAYGWYGHLLDVFSKYCDNGWNFSESYEQARNRELATLRLLQLELALRLYEHDHGKHPDSLDALVLKYVEAVPVDPMSPEQEPLRCVEAESGIVPYSVGYNGIDDSGKADADEPTFGDLRLDVLWAPQPSASQPGAAMAPDRDGEPETESDEEN